MIREGKQLALCGTALQIGCLVGLGGTIVGICRAFEEVSHSNAFDAAALASAIGAVLYPTVIGLLLSLIGAVLLLRALFASRYRASWFHVTILQKTFVAVAPRLL